MTFQGPYPLTDYDLRGPFYEKFYLYCDPGNRENKSCYICRSLNIPFFNFKVVKGTKMIFVLSVKFWASTDFLGDCEEYTSIFMCHYNLMLLKAVMMERILM